MDSNLINNLIDNFNKGDIASLRVLLDYLEESGKTDLLKVSVGLERKIIWRPAYNQMASGHGRHCAECTFVLKGPKGAITFLIFTGWMLSKDAEELRHQGVNLTMGAGIDYHTYGAQYEGQASMESCVFLDGKTCYSDGSSLAGRDLFDKFVAEGEEVVWKELELRYNEL